MSPQPIDPVTRSLLPDAVDAVITAELVTVSLIQRRVRVGFATGLRLITALEELGVVAPADQKGRWTVRDRDRAGILSRIKEMP